MTSHYGLASSDAAMPVPDEGRASQLTRQSHIHVSEAVAQFFVLIVSFEIGEGACPARTAGNRLRRIASLGVMDGFESARLKLKHARSACDRAFSASSDWSEVEIHTLTAQTEPAGTACRDLHSTDALRRTGSADPTLGQGMVTLGPGLQRGNRCVVVSVLEARMLMTMRPGSRLWFRRSPLSVSSACMAVASAWWEDEMVMSTVIAVMDPRVTMLTPSGVFGCEGENRFEPAWVRWRALLGRGGRLVPSC